MGCFISLCERNLTNHLKIDKFCFNAYAGTVHGESANKMHVSI